MFQKQSLSIPSDSSGVLLSKVIETRKCSRKKHAKIGRFLKVVLINVKPELIKKRRKKTRAIVVRSSHIMRKRDCFFNFCDNGLVLLKKRMNTVGKELLGPTSKILKIKKFKIAFKFIF